PVLGVYGPEEILARCLDLARPIAEDAEGLVRPAPAVLVHVGQIDQVELPAPQPGDALGRGEARLAFGQGRIAFDELADIRADDHRAAVGQAIVARLRPAIDGPEGEQPPRALPMRRDATGDEGSPIADRIGIEAPPAVLLHQFLEGDAEL